MEEQLNKEKDMEMVRELAKATLKGWKIEKLCNTVYATYRGDILSADCIKVAHTDEELRSVLENLRTGVLYHLFGGLEERLNESMVEYLSEFERLL